MAQALTMAAIDEPADADLPLVLAAQAEPAAFEALYERYWPRVFRYFAARASSPEEAADLAQSVFEKAYHALPAYRRSRSPFAAWLFRIARNAAIDAHRRRRTEIHLAAVPDLLAQAGDPECAAIESERVSLLRARIAVLAPDQRELLELRFAAGLSSREIADVVGKRQAAVKRQLTRIVAQLKESYREDPE